VNADPHTPSNPARRLAVLVAFVLGGLSLAFLFPDGTRMRESAIAMSLPERIDAWKGTSRPPSAEEGALLAPDTRFEKMDYAVVHPVWDTPAIHDWHHVAASIVLSGQDLNSSIHRPERCLPAQGFKDIRSSVIELDVGDRKLSVVRLRCYTEPTDKQSGKAYATPKGERLRIQHVVYYWFVGSHAVTTSHYERTWIDLKDRLLGGFDQHWAYVMVSASFTDDLVRSGLPAGDELYKAGRTEAETDHLLEQIARGICRHSMRWDRIK
jgi:hypothetical protein